jgi:hypothetical protein
MSTILLLLLLLRLLLPFCCRLCRFCFELSRSLLLFHGWCFLPLLLLF